MGDFVGSQSRFDLHGLVAGPPTQDLINQCIVLVNSVRIGLNLQLVE